VPLPADVAVVPPPPAVAPELAWFSGAWGGGAWDGSVPAALVVERIEADGRAVVVVAWGDGGSPLNPPGWLRLEARIEAGRLKLATDDTIQDYAPEPGGGLLGHRQLAEGWRPEEGWRSYVHLRRIAAGAPEGIAAALDLAVPRAWREQRIPVTSTIAGIAGKTVLLEATIYRSPLAGRRPAVVINHGTQDAASLVTRRYQEQARLIVDLGFTVVVPMRKGFGGSEGPLFEASVMPPALQLGSALEDLDAVVGWLARDAAVDRDRLVLVGADRGGFLSIAYASLYPGRVASVINVSGLWQSEHLNDGFNMMEFRKAGATIRIPTLWLYADNDSYYPPRSVRADFAAYQAAGGTGRLIELHAPEGDGHALFSWIEAWAAPAEAELRRIAAVP
jgi:dienelactone hydrolase